MKQKVWFVSVAFALVKQDNLLETHANRNKTHVILNAEMQLLWQ